MIKDGSEYFGPFTWVKIIHTLLELTSQLYKLRNCTLILSEENIEEKFKVCLEYHIGELQRSLWRSAIAEDYDQNIKDIRQILKGNINTVIQHLIVDRIIRRNLNLKKQQGWRKNWIAGTFQIKICGGESLFNTDVYSILTDEDAAYVNFPHHEWFHYSGT